MSQAEKTWRFLPFASGSAAYNMAVDEAILNHHVAGQVQPTLRLYQFSPPAVSLGYAQTLSSKHLSQLKNLGYDIVKRPTGGRAVLHLNDLTYSFVAPTGSTAFSADTGSLSASVVQAHKEICGALIETFRQFGITLELGRSQSDYRQFNDCFEATTTADLHFDGKKIVGSAQLRRKSSLLQHGSVVLKASPTSLADLLADNHKDRSAVIESKKPGSLFELLGREVSFEQFERAFKTGFGLSFGVSLSDGQLSPSELAEVESLKGGYQMDLLAAAREAHRR